MEGILLAVKGGSVILKSLFLLVVGVFTTFAVQFIFYIFIKLYNYFAKKNK
ncbi:MAG TPA: hypothetical protein PK449_06405 [Exilispira sp.]|jgi:hypothetical protein|nr:hypothetical protein [Exilispira sp.]